MMTREDDGPRFVGDLVWWGMRTTVSRNAFDDARTLLQSARRVAEIDALQLQTSPLQTSTRFSNSDHRIAGSITEPHTAPHVMRVEKKEREAMTVREVAAEAAVRPWTVYYWIREGKLPAKRIQTGTLRVLRTDFRRFMGFENGGAEE